MVRGNSSIEQMLFEEVKEKKTLSATPHANQNFDKIVAFSPDKLVEKDVTFD